MSSYATHMLIGAVGGLALERALTALVGPIPAQPFAAALPAAPLLVRPLLQLGGIGIVALSALLASWPDIDEPGSWISRRVRAVLPIFGLALGALGGIAATGPLWRVPAGMLVGLVAGVISGPLLLRGIRAAAGGHRRLTHSLVLGLALVGIAAALWLFGLHAWAALPVALAWGQALHVVGDVVTPGGVPVLYPLSERDLRLLPAPVNRAGELIVGVAALVVGFVLIR